MTEHEERQLDEAVEARLFLRDKRHLWLAETDENFNALENFLNEHDLPVTAENLHRGFEELVARGELELIPLAKDAPVPQPTIPPAPQATAPEVERDTRLHVAERLPGESRLGVLQRSFADEIAAQRRARMQMRAAMQSAPIDSARITAAREANNQYAKSMRSYGKGAAFITGKEE